MMEKLPLHKIQRTKHVMMNTKATTASGDRRSAPTFRGVFLNDEVEVEKDPEQVLSGSVPRSLGQHWLVLCMMPSIASGILPTCDRNHTLVTSVCGDSVWDCDTQIRWKCTGVVGNKCD
jgi:hypothetical protein